VEVSGIFDRQNQGRRHPAQGQISGHVFARSGVGLLNQFWARIYGQKINQESILRLWNLQLQRRRCSRLERFFKAEENIF
jgi:hypothetical protein